MDGCPCSYPDRTALVMTNGYDRLQVKEMVGTEEAFRHRPHSRPPGMGWKAENRLSLDRTPDPVPVRVWPAIVAGETGRTQPSSQQ